MALRPARRFDIPHRDGEYMELRKLSWTQTEQAQKAKQRAYFEEARDVPEELRDAFKPSEEDIAAARAKAADKDDTQAKRPKGPEMYDWGVVLRAGVAGWSFRDDAGEEIPVTDDNLADLEFEDAEWAVKTILGMSQLPTKEETGKPSAPSAVS